MGYAVLSGMHTLAMFILYLFNLLNLLAVLFRINDKPYKHWQDQYLRESRIISTVSTLYSFKATRMLYGNFLQKPYFDAACEDRYRVMIRPFFVVTMASVIHTAIIAIANVYAIWQLRWGYEIVTLSISSLIMAVVIFALEIYEFVLFKNKEPEFMGVNDYFKS